MLNTNNYKSGDVNVRFNSVSGTLVKSHPKSFFIHRTEKAYIFDEDAPCLKYMYNAPYGKVVVLQVMIIGQNSLLCEVVKEEDWEATNG